MKLGGSFSNSNYQVTSLLGNIVLKGTLGTTNSIDIGAVAAGVYLVKIFNANGSVINKRFVKN